MGCIQTEQPPRLVRTLALHARFEMFFEERASSRAARGREKHIQTKKSLRGQPVRLFHPQRMLSVRLDAHPPPHPEQHGCATGQQGQAGGFGDGERCIKGPYSRPYVAVVTIIIQTKPKEHTS